jgi:hypothetical protein
MNDTFCNYNGRRDEVLVAYVYEDIDHQEREAFERHLEECLPCRTELAALSDVRSGLQSWAAPEVAAGVGGKPPRTALRLVDTAPKPSGWRTVADAPVWLQAAAAMLVVGASLGLANINLSYSRDGLSVSTGWIRRVPIVVSPAAPAAEQQEVAAPVDAAALRIEMAALEERLSRELSAQPVTSASPSADEALLKRVRALVQESERRQQRELALRVAELARDAQAQRQADLVRIDRSLGLMQSRTGVEVMRTQQQLNTLAQRVSQRQ